jgi:hypothetical protein
MLTLAQAVPLVIGGLGSSVAVAAAALVVVLTIVLVFIMVLRSNGAGKRTASGLGYDAQMGPLGQPQNGADGGAPWQRPGGQPGWSDPADMGQMPAQAGRGQAAWGQPQDFGGGKMPASPGAPGQAPWGKSPDAGGWGEPAAPAGPAGWGAPAGQGAGAWGGRNDAWGGQQPTADGWNAAQAPVGRQGPPSGANWGAPANPQAPQGWDAAGQGAGAAARGGWGSPAPAAPAQPPASPWDQPEQQGPVWNSAQPTVPAGSQAPQQDWGNPAPAPSGGGWGTNQPPAPGGWSAPAGAPAPQGAPAASAAYGDADRTRIAARPEAGPRTGMIVVRQGKEPGRMFELRKDRVTIGRSRDSDIFLEDLAVSRLHTTINRESGGYVLRDEGSANGTYVNGKRITEQPLEEGDEIQVGQSVLAFVRR